ncbi:MAG: glutamate 5-kinase [Deltaproteobacteria bacterium]|nr:glutamate 5-kinase [Deltaproteobacteria bacterium]
MDKANLRKNIINKATRIIIKVGSAVLAGSHHEGLDSRVFHSLAKGVSDIKKSGRDVVIVSSGAIAIGMKKMGLHEKPKTISEKQAIASIGQVSLMSMYEKAFAPLNKKVAQILLTHDDIADKKRFQNARHTIKTLFNYGIIPIINENDTVAVEEIKFGDNDNLAALVTHLVDADLLVILTDTDGLYDKDPKHDRTAVFIPFVDDIDSLTVKTLGASGKFGTGGFASKVSAAKKALDFGVPTLIVNGNDKEILGKVFDGKEVGTFFMARGKG